MEVKKDGLSFIDCVDLLNMAAKKGLIDRDPNDRNSILVYRENVDPAVYGAKEGWFSENILSGAAPELFQNRTAQEMLVRTLMAKERKILTLHNLLSICSTEYNFECEIYSGIHDDAETYICTISDKGSNLPEDVLDGCISYITTTDKGHLLVEVNTNAVEFSSLQEEYERLSKSVASAPNKSVLKGIRLREFVSNPYFDINCSYKVVTSKAQFIGEFFGDAHEELSDVMECRIMSIFLDMSERNFTIVVLAEDMEKDPEAPIQIEKLPDTLLIQELRNRGYKVGKSTDPICVDTIAGELRAYTLPESGYYPAVSIMFVPKGMDTEIDLMTAEVHEVDQDYSVYGYLYEDVFTDDCTRRITWRAEDLTAMVQEYNKNTQ
ncbi:MAG: hypothetical protein Q4B26_00915 [Eubacteriales bacterium]|nr:hypothetical protein [Eubacteriales bacterium]